MATEAIDGGLEDQNAPTPSFSRAFEGLSRNVIGEIYRDIQIPSSLYHYTSSEGLMGMLGEHKLRFSDATFMNDGSEVTWGIRLAHEAIDELLETKPQAEKDAGDALKLEIERAMIALQPVIFCMSARNNLLNQWRDYGKDVVPYCIEFDVQQFQNWNGKSFPIFVTKIVYDDTKQKSLIKSLLLQIYDKAKLLQGDKPNFEEDEAQGLLRSASAEIASLITRFKNPAFEAEEEWRAICFRPQLESVPRKYRSSSLGVVPFYEWYTVNEAAHLPVKSVTVGPSPYAQVSDLALKQFLIDNGYDVVTHFSTIPIRR